MRFGSRSRPDLTVAAGERLLAWCVDAEGNTLGGTRDALYLPGVRLPWEEIEAADWDRESETLRVSEVGTWGEPRNEHRFTLAEPGRLLELVRERVTASVVLQRHVSVEGRRGLRIVARRGPRGDTPVRWFFEYDEGIDPDEPAVRAAAADAFARAQADLGL